MRIWFCILYEILFLVFFALSLSSPKTCLNCEYFLTSVFFFISDVRATYCIRLLCYNGKMTTYNIQYSLVFSMLKRIDREKKMTAIAIAQILMPVLRLLNFQNVPFVLSRCNPFKWILSFRMQLKQLHSSCIANGLSLSLSDTVCVCVCCLYLEINFGRHLLWHNCNFWIHDFGCYALLYTISVCECK